MSPAAVVERTRRFSKRSRFTDAQIEEISEGAKPAIHRWVKSAATEQRITPKANTFARAVSRLSDGVIDPDPIEEILVAMSKARIISSHQRGLLQVRYLR